MCIRDREGALVQGADAEHMEEIASYELERMRDMDAYIDIRAKMCIRDRVQNLIGGVYNVQGQARLVLTGARYGYHSSSLRDGVFV